MPEHLRDKQQRASDTPLQWLRIKWPVIQNRDAEFMNQDRLAALLGVAGTSMSNWERGFAAPSLSKRAKYAQQLGVTKRDLEKFIEVTGVMGAAHFVAIDLLKRLGVNINRIDTLEELDKALKRPDLRPRPAVVAEDDVTVYREDVEAAIVAIKKAGELADELTTNFSERWFATHPQTQSA